MKKTLLFILMIMLIGAVNAQVFISQNCDPRINYAADRFAEIYNPTGDAIDLTGWTLENIQGGSVSFTWTLSGTIAGGEALICGNADATDQTITPDITATWAGNSWNGKGGDGTILKNANGDVVDYAVQDDATGKFENAQMVRNSNITTPTSTYDATEWTFSSVDDAVDATPGTHTADAAALVATDLFFSEYVEGKVVGNNRAIEIFNGTGADVDLSAYSVKQSYGGQGWGIREATAMIEYVLPLSGTLADGDVYIFYNVDAEASISDVGDLPLTYNAGTDGCRMGAFTGNDPIGLFKNDVLIDVIGIELSTDGPWAVAGVAGATQDHTLVRKSTITQGNTDWAAAAGTDADDSEWIVFDNATEDKVDGLGSHTFGASTADETAPTFTSTPDDGDTGVAVDTEIVLTFNEAIRNIDDSEITDANVAALLTLKETDTAGAGVTFTATIDADKKVITVTPDVDLVMNQLYYVAIAPVEDALDNATTEATMTFTTISAATDVTITLIQSTTSDGDLSTYDGSRVRVTGIITAINGDNFWLQEAAPATKDSQYPEWSGIYGYDATLAAAAVVGDEVTLEATVEEYYNLTELGSVTSYTINSSGNTINPVAVTAAAALESYESILITIVDAEVTVEANNYGEFTINDGTADYKVDDKIFEYVPTLGDVLDITGVISYSFGSFVLFPRTADDVTVSSALGFDDLRSREVSVYPNPSNGRFYVQMGDAFKVNTKIEVFNIIGMKVLETITNDFKTEIDLSAMKQGVYYVRVDDGQNIVTQKVMKQ